MTLKTSNWILPCPQGINNITMALIGYIEQLHCVGLVRYLIRISHGNEVGCSCDQRLFFFSSALCASLTRLRREISLRKKYPSGTQGTYHPEASKFSLYVRNNAGVFHPANQSHGIFFAQIWNQRIEPSLFFNNGGLCREHVCKTAQERLFEP